MSASSGQSGDSEPIVREATLRMTDPEADALCALFADGLESGLGYTRIIDMLERQDVDDKIVGRLRQALLEDGDTLGEAFARFGLLDATARKLVRVAEQQGTLPRTFHQLSEHYARRHERRRDFVSSLVEPCILVALGLLVARNLFTADFAAFVETMDVAGFLKPAFEQAAVEVAIFGSLAVAGAYIFLNLPVETPLRSLIRRLWVRLPLGVLNKAARLQALGLFFRYVQKSLVSGLTVHRSLALAAKASDDPELERNIERAREAIEAGQTLAEAFKISEAIPRDAVDVIDVGEEAGELDKRLEELADKYQQRAQEHYEAKRKVILYLLRFAVIVIVVLMLLFTIIEMLGGTFADATDGMG